jgi:hypothetical protein
LPRSHVGSWSKAFAMSQITSEIVQNSDGAMAAPNDRHSNKKAIVPDKNHLVVLRPISSTIMALFAAACG